MLVVMPASRAQPAPDQVEFPLRSGDAPLRLLAEGVQDVERGLEPHGVDRPIRVAAVARGDLKDAGAEALERLGVAVPAPAWA